MPELALTIFTGAFLLFLLQPLIGKFILPWFGGSPAVWTTCMLFFQLVLLGGYAYAHLSARLLKPRWQALLHVALLAAAVLFLPITPAASWKPVSPDQPVWHILSLLFVCVGLPYFVLSTTGPLIQEWFRRLHPGVSPYRLYALSNLGSLLALLSYPFVFEPNFTRKTQALIWSAGLGLFVLLCGRCAWRVWRLRIEEKVVDAPQLELGERSAKIEKRTSDAPQSAIRNPQSAIVLWLLLPACASVLLLAITNKICQDVAVIPFLWVVPLAIYLLSFIICFDSPGLYSRNAFAVALGGALVLLCEILFEGTVFPILLQLGIYCAVLFLCCMICHGELYKLRPEPSRMTAYYLTISAGGAAGGLFVAVIAPLIFNSFAELHWGLWTCTLLLAFLYARDNTAIAIAGRGVPVWKAVLVGVLLLGFTLRAQAVYAARKTTTVTRNFYGVLRVCEEKKDDPSDYSRVMISGNIMHGLQFQNLARALTPTTYYHEQSGVGLALRQLRRTGGRRIGVVGLGAGTLATYGDKGDYIRYYEINPEVKRLAQTEFTFLSNCQARLDVVLGDARLVLENEQAQQFDLLVLDAFTSDAIPVHLLTREAVEVYRRHLKPDGVLAIHITNRHLDLRPVVETLAAEFGLGTTALSFAAKDRSWWMSPCDWVLMTRDKAFLEQEAIRTAKSPRLEDLSRAPQWTDDYTSLFKILKW